MFRMLYSNNNQTFCPLTNVWKIKKKRLVIKNYFVSVFSVAEKFSVNTIIKYKITACVWYDSQSNTFYIN